MMVNIDLLATINQISRDTFRYMDKYINEPGYAIRKTQDNYECFLILCCLFRIAQNNLLNALDELENDWDMLAFPPQFTPMLVGKSFSIYENIVTGEVCDEDSIHDIGEEISDLILNVKYDNNYPYETNEFTPTDKVYRTYIVPRFLGDVELLMSMLNP